MTQQLRTVLDDVLAGHRLTEEEAVRLLMIRDRGVLDIAAAADEIRERMVGETVTYVRNQNINVTNLCVNACGFCGFSRKP
ncbi:7,8-didemethyl-8-hydroxy-5-deazariboflavin synthase subunit CofH, partial [Methanoculleus bourgensis]